MIYSVIDLETTGFCSNLHDRIVEIGITVSDDNGTILDTFETLINPMRDIGAIAIHGITAEMVLNAPAFNDIAETVLSILDNTIVIAHNANFDIRFLNSEYSRAGYSNFNWQYVCTLTLARKYLQNLPSKKLDAICKHYGVDYKDKHSALSDSLVTTHIFHKIKNQFGVSFDNDQVFKYSGDAKYHRSLNILPRAESKSAIENYQSPLNSLLNDLPEVRSDNVDEDHYLSLLDEILLDRIVTKDELTALTKVANEYNISKDKMLALNTKYLNNLIRHYLSDNIISDSEKSDIEKVKSILLLSDYNTDELISNARNSCDDYESPEKDLKDKLVCFTGQFSCVYNGLLITREMAYELADRQGMIIKKNVSKKLNYLVLADVNSMSTKARKARELGVTLISEPAFWKMLGIQTE